MAQTWASLVDPEDYFDPLNVMIHGIDESVVVGAPRLPEVHEVICRVVTDLIAVCHTFFDRAAIVRAFDRYELAPLQCTWLNTAAVTRRCWPDCARRGYGLGSIAERLGIDYEAHDAAEDARAAGEVLLRAIAHTDLDVRGWLERVRHPIDPSKAYESSYARLAGNADGPLYGEMVVFTGAMSLPRREAAALAAAAGCSVLPEVTHKTTLLVVGDQDLRKLAGHDKSMKHRRAEELIAEGRSIRILAESDFRHLVGLAPNSANRR